MSTTDTRTSDVEELVDKIEYEIQIGHLYKEDDVGFAKFTKEGKETLASLLTSFREKVVADQREMFARHIDDILKITTNPHELVDWLAFYRNTLTPPKEI